MNRTHVLSLKSSGLGNERRACRGNSNLPLALIRRSPEAIKKRATTVRSPPDDSSSPAPRPEWWQVLAKGSFFDEADTVLIDEAGVAPVLSPPEGMAARRNFTATPLALARQMRDSLDFRRTSNGRRLELTSAGQMRLQQCRRNHISCGARRSPRGRGRDYGE